jgi:hypothetical protein
MVHKAVFEKMKETIDDLKRRIEEGDIPKDSEEYGGGGLIITNDPNWKGHEGDLVILTEYSKEISWLVFRLQELGAFVPNLGVLTKLYTDNNCSLKNTLYALVHLHEACMVKK